MYDTKMKNSFEGSPLEIIRRYAFWIIGATCGLGILATLYYKAHTGGSNIIDGAVGSTTDVINDSKTTITDSIDRMD